MLGGVVATQSNSFDILKAQDDLIIAGYASIEMVDKQNDLITLKALEEAVQKFMDKNEYRNVMTNHSNVQVGEVVNKYRDSKGQVYKTQVDDVGFFVVIKLRDDIEKAKEVSRNIRQGTLRSFSIGGQALEKRTVRNQEMGEYNEISKLELHEVTICEKGINPEAKFDILKQEKNKVKKMNELEKALGELNELVKNMNLSKEEDEDETNKGYGKTDMEMGHGKEHDEELEMADDPSEDEDVEDMAYKGKKEKDEDPEATKKEDDEEEGNTEKALELNTYSEAGEVVFNGTSTKKHPQDAEFKMSPPTLDLSAANLEKAYEAFRAEKLEAMTYDNLNKTFNDRFNSEIKANDAAIAKANYNAQAEVADLKAQFASLKKSLTEEKQQVIAKQEQVVNNLNIPSTDDIVKMSWDELHSVIDNLENR